MEVQYAENDSRAAGEVALLGLPGLSDPNWRWVRRALKWMLPAGWMASANRNHIPDVSYPFEGEALSRSAARG
jgi:hypothetical protein